jgi:zinc resistance-associated protein
MKKVLVVALVVVFGALVSTAALAAWTKGQGPATQVDVNAFRNFQKETLPLRDEMMVKRLEIRNEYSKATPDEAKITALKEEMIALRTQISEAAKRNGLPDQGFGPGYGKRGGFGPGACARGGYGPGGCAGYGPGNGRGSCPMGQ